MLQIGTTAYQGGVSVAIADLCLGLAQSGHKVGLMCNGGAVLDRLKGAGVSLFLSETISGTSSIFTRAVQTAGVIRSFRPDVIHVHGRGPSLASTMAGRYPDCFTLHNTHLTTQVSRLDAGLIRKYLSPLGRKIIVLNSAARDYCRTDLNISKDRIAYVSNAVDHQHFAPLDPLKRLDLRARMGCGPDQLLVLFVGRFHPSKQPQAVVQLAEATRDLGCDGLKFAMVGDGELKAATEAMVSDLGLDDRVEFFEYQDPREFYQAADLVVLPSLYEGFALVMLEAMASGCAVLRTRTGGFAETIDEGVTGYGCDVEVEDFITRAIEILQDREGLAKVAANGQRKVASEFSLASQAKAISEVYEQALAYKAQLPVRH